MAILSNLLVYIIYKLTEDSLAFSGVLVDTGILQNFGKDLMITRRIVESRYLLSETDLSLTQIAQMLGFSSPSYFSQAFRKAQGISPIDYRKSTKRL